MKKISMVASLVLLALPIVASAASLLPSRVNSSSAPVRAVTAPTSASSAQSVQGQGVDDIKTNSASSAQEGGKVEHEWKVEEGESAPGQGIDDITTNSTSSAAPGVEPDEIDANTNAEATASSQKNTPKGGGNVEFEWKVEEGESIPSVGPDDIKAEVEEEVDMSILFAENASEAARSEAADTLVQKMEEAGSPIESISLNFDKIVVKATQPGKLFGFISMNVVGTVDIDAQQQVKVKFPWWSFLVSGKDGDSLGQHVFSSLSNVFEANFDTLKNSMTRH